MFEEAPPPIERNDIPMVEYKPWEDMLSRFGQYFSRGYGAGQQQFDPGSLQALWQKWQEESAIQDQEQQTFNAKEALVKQLRSYGQNTSGAQL